MPTYAPVSSTVVQTPSVLATLNDYANEELVPQGYVRELMYGLLYGPAMEPGLGSRPKVPIPSFRRPQKHTGSGTQVEMILNFETSGNMQAYNDLETLNTGIYQGGTKIFSDFADYTTYVGLSRAQALRNTGSGKQFDLLKSMLQMEDRKATTTLETDILSTNTDIDRAGGQKSLPGIRHWNSTSPTSTLFGLNRTVYTPYKNNVATIASFATGGLDGMESFFYTTSGTNGNDPVDLILTTPTVHGYYTKQAQAVHRLVGDLSGVDLGVKGVVYFRGIPMLWSPRHPSGRQDWINTADLHTWVLAGNNWDSETPGKPNNLAVKYEQRRYFSPALMHARPETNGVITVTAA